MSQATTTTKKVGHRIYITLHEDIVDMRTAENFKQVLNEAYLRDIKEVIIDFRLCKTINSYGIGKMLMFYQKFSDIGGKLYVTGISGFIREVFDTMLLKSIIKEV